MAGTRAGECLAGRGRRKRDAFRRSPTHARAGREGPGGARRRGPTWCELTHRSTEPLFRRRCGRRMTDTRVRACVVPQSSGGRSAARGPRDRDVRTKDSRRPAPAARRPVRPALRARARRPDAARTHPARCAVFRFLEGGSSGCMPRRSRGAPAPCRSGDGTAPPSGARYGSIARVCRRLRTAERRGRRMRSAGGA